MTPSSAKRRPAGFAAAAFSLVFAATGFACAGAPPAQAAPADTAARAAAYLTDNIPATWDSVGAALDTALGLIASGRCDDDEAAAAILDSAAAAPDYAESGPVAAAKTAVAAAAAGRDPRDFGGLDLVQLIADGTDPATGQVGPYGYAFGQALAILALQRAGAAVPDAAVDYLLTFQDAAGAFGFSFGGAFSPDPDSTALALMALAETGQTEAVSRAVAWAAANQTAEGYWDGFSPIDSTGLLGGALAEQGVDVSAAAAWLAAQQLADGGFPNGLGLTESNAMTTANALYLLSGRTYATASTALAGCPTEPTAEPTSEPTAEPTGEPTAGPTGEPTDEPTGQPTLPDTGGPAGQGPFGAAGLVLLILGGVLLKMARAVSPAPLR